MIGRSKLIKITITVLLFAGGVFWYGWEKSNQVTRGDLLRFHVIANSDSVYDQKIKLLVRDEVIKYMEPYLSQAQTAEEAASIVQKQSPVIKQVADNCLGAHEVGYNAHVELGNFNFPVKAYGNLILPEGKYQAMRVVLGEGQGKNWWCVLFPPLCFIDISNSIAVRQKEPKPVEETHQVSVKPVQMEIRFRILDWWKKLGQDFTL